MIPLDRVRAMLRLGSDAAQESWTWRYDDADGCRVIENPRARFEEERRIAEMCASSDADAALIAAAPDLARDVLTLAAALETAERERDAYRERDAFLMHERIAVATALDVPYATLLGEAVALRLARLTTERDAALASADLSARAAVDAARELGHVAAAAVAERDTARSAHAELAAAVRAVGGAVAEHGCSCDCDCAHTTGEHTSACDPCLACRVSRVVSPVLSAAPPRSTVPARLVRELLDGYVSGKIRHGDFMERLAALAGCV